MIESKALPEFKSYIETLVNQLSLFETKVKEAPEIEPGEKGPEEERERILSVLGSYKKKAKKIEQEAAGPLCRNGAAPIDLSRVLEGLKEIDKTVIELKNDIEKIADDQYECKLEMYKQEIFKSADLIISAFDFILPNIRFELNYMEKYYREPGNMGNSVTPELNELVNNLEEHDTEIIVQKEEGVESDKQFEAGETEEEVEEVEEVEEQIDLTKLRVVELRKLCSETGKTGYKSLKKQELINLLLN